MCLETNVGRFESFRQRKHEKKNAPTMLCDGVTSVYPFGIKRWRKNLFAGSVAPEKLAVSGCAAHSLRGRGVQILVLENYTFLTVLTEVAGSSIFAA